METFVPTLKRSKGFEGLKEEIIDAGLCTSCGTCSSFCYHIRMNEKPELETDCSLADENVIKCSENGTCYDVCPMTETDVKTLEERFLDGELDEELGIVKQIVGGKTGIDGQDGGVVSSLLCAGMEKGLFDAAIVAQREDGFRAKPIIVVDREGILEARGTKYIAVPMVDKIGDAIRDGKRNIAIVGTPCEVRGVRKMQDVLLRNVPQIDLTVIGLFCFESFDYELLRGKTKELLGVDLGEAEKTEISKGKYIVTVDGKACSCKVSELDEAVRKNCTHCDDFTARLADISVGSVGTGDGYSTMIIRSKRGKEIFNLLEVFSETTVSREEIVRVASLKKKRRPSGG
jgi:coenzyme F420 hydrogenase subunit beta